MVDLIHDRWLDAEAIVFDSVNSTLSIRYLGKERTGSGFISRPLFPAHECFIRLSGVKSYSVHDTQKVRFYDIDTIQFDPKSMAVELRTGIPIEIRAVVSSLDVTAEETDAVIQG